MWQFVIEHAAALTVIVTGLTLIVWTVYGQLMSANQKRQQKPRLFIKQGDGTGLDSMCLFSNMGKEFVYLRGVFVNLHTQDGDQFCELVEKEWDTDGAGCTAEEIGQGPVESSQQVALGPFYRLVREAARKAGFDASAESERDDALWRQIRAFEVTAIVTVGPYEQTIGAERSFSVDHANARLVPDSAGTTLRCSRRDARTLRRYLISTTEATA
ncbi:hypothetical protein J7355_03310 [Endozoicomonas sp. G2_2]|uniref:hypothetical protein n=1 Tax=Endozoicomonas sp. G2_2 TaxID=2821092 RepID=UPI001ADA3539|nr:hypothetical protein [Endozoicomonas sp. G2_2]MBO9469120.1 hypothetical protein [Endozoicomonas sp. G2_2]